MKNGFYYKIILGKIDDDLSIDTGFLVDILEEMYPGDTVPSTNTLYCTAPFNNFR